MERYFPSEEAADIFQMVGEFSARELKSQAGDAEASATFPRDIFAKMGGIGLLALPYPARYGGGEQDYVTYLQLLEVIAHSWMSVGVGLSVHTMSCYPIAVHGTDAQREELLPAMLGGELLGAYALSEAQAGSDVAALATRAVRDGEDYVLNGTKTWITHGGRADYYTLFARTSQGRGGLSCFHVPADVDGLSFGAPEHKMGLSASPTTAVHLDEVRIPVRFRVGEEGAGQRIALSALTSGRLGIAACATGLAQAALDAAVGYARERRQFGQPIADFQGMQFLLADMSVQVDTARALYLTAAERRDRGLDFVRSSATAKLSATDAVQVLGGFGYTEDFPVERYLREAKITQIFEGTNQIQRLVIARQLLGG